MQAKNKYLPVNPVFFEITDSFMQQVVRVVYFGENQSLEESNGKLKGILKNKSGEFMNIQSDENVRIDRVITINGNPGPAFDEYDAYANACLSCQAGYDD
ncbi:MULTISPECIES: hypothetical protein [unclassified Saccharicrinis]|uniref:hypothetical protein n=1 Tax=unclassified Saccharicrinis TaxID=2646859 RepID=UPI003D326E81